MKMLCKFVIMSTLVMTAAFPGMAQQGQEQMSMMGQGTGQGGMIGQGGDGGRGGMMGPGMMSDCSAMSGMMGRGMQEMMGPGMQGMMMGSGPIMEGG